MNKNLLAVALASLLVGGVAVAAFNSFRSNDNPQAGLGTDPNASWRARVATSPPTAQSSRAAWNTRTWST
jgi:hypothetical protein